MKLKTYSLRLDEEEFEKLRKALSEYGDPDLNIGYLLRSYISDLNAAIPHLKKSSLGLRNNLSFWSTAFRQISRTVDLENILKGKILAEHVTDKDREAVAGNE